MRFQTLAVYTETGKNAVALAEKQFTIFRTLPTIYPDDFQHVKAYQLPKDNGKVHIMAAIENASGLCTETEPLERAFSRFDKYRETAGPLLYISFTWNHENRFGGGNQSKKGLKDDGKRLLDYLDGTQIAIDLSHTSDALAHDIIDYIEAKNLKITPIASHSNFRKITKVARNLPDELAKEIIKRGGVIGLNLVKSFIGKNFEQDLTRHVDYMRSLGGFDNYCFGADFFHIPNVAQPLITFFQAPYNNAGCYPELMQHLNEVFTAQELEKIAHTNFANFLDRVRTC